MASFLAPIVAYLLGSISFGMLIAVKRGVNLREQGSGNIGSTNVLRVIGKREAVLTLAGDVLKGTGAVLVARFLTDGPVWLALAGLAAIVGHNFPLYYRFKGGKGVATTFGVLFAYMPWVGLILLVIWGGAVWWTRISSVGALSVSAALPLLSFWFFQDPVHRFFGAAAALMMVVRHKDNVGRLLRGEER
ncbi:MAG: glycerol-3-phosphate 1-O-acyltransferase PlsY [bacterium]|nr:glycerol-3-phosphate 1-O-acyltransferase PlsY [bacterium]